jgi:hypothetical protein
MIGVRNIWAHVSASFPARIPSYRTLNAHPVFSPDEPSGMIPDLEQFKARVERPGSI